MYNRTTVTATDFASSLSSDKVSVSESIQECVDFADIVFTCVGDDAALNDMIETAVSEGKV